MPNLARLSVKSVNSSSILCESKIADPMGCYLEYRGVIINTGSGIGKAIALFFASEGANIAVSDVKLPAAEQTVEEVKRLGSEAIAIKADCPIGKFNTFLPSGPFSLHLTPLPSECRWGVSPTVVGSSHRPRQNMAWCPPAAAKGICPIKRGDIVYTYNKGYTNMQKTRSAHWRNYKGGIAYGAILGDVIKTETLEEVLH